MTDRSASTSTGEARAWWIGLIGICLLAVWSSGAGADAQQELRNETLRLLEKAQDEEDGARSTELFEKALVQIEQGLERSRNDPLQHGQWLHTQWFYFMYRDDHVHAKAVAEKALGYLGRAQTSPQLIADLRSNLAFSLRVLGEVARAKQELRTSIALAAGSGDKELLAGLYYNIGDAYRKTGDRLVARRYFEDAYAIDRERDDAEMMLFSESKLGNLARDAGNYDDAISRHRRAFEGLRPDSYRRLVVETELARDYAMQGELGSAEQHVRHVLQDPRLLSELHIDASIALLSILNDRRAQQGAANGREAAALVARIDALFADIAKRAGSDAHPTLRLQFAEQAIRHYSLNQDLSSVTARGQGAIELTRRVAAGLPSSDDALAWLTEAQPVMNEYVKALYARDKAKVLPLLEAYYSVPVTAGSDDGVIGQAFENEAIKRLNHYRDAELAVMAATTDLALLEAYRTQSAARITDARNRLRNAQRTRDQARDVYLWGYEKPPGNRYAQVVKPFALGPGRPIPADDVFIRYFVQEQVSFGVAIAGTDIAYFDLPQRSEVTKLVDRTLQVLQERRGGEPLNAALSALTRLLPLDFIARHPHATRLVIVSDDAMQRLPFAAIDIDTTSEQYRPLIGKFEIVRARSARDYYGDLAASSINAPTVDIVVFADPVVEVPLQGSRREAASIAQYFPQRSLRNFTGLAATSDALLSREAREARILNIATHGYYTDTSPELVGLATSRPGNSGAGFVGLTDLFSQTFYSRLVVISGCETMRGKDYSGWGVRSLADGFLTQGAASVIGTLWNVSDAATATLMQEFYHVLAGNGGDTSDALARAQRSLADSKRYADPYNWAGIVLESTNRSIDQQVF